MVWKIPLFKTYSDQADVDAVSAVIKRGSYWAVGPEVEQFEKKIAEFLNIKYVLTFNSGTSALHTLLLAHDVKEKEVIIPSFTFIATANAVVLAGGKPVFAESESVTFSLDAGDVKKRITNKTKAITLIQYGGFPARDTEELRKIADENNLILIEDAAQSFGAKIGNKKVGTMGHSAIFSLCQDKVISTGEGGIMATDSEEVFEKAKLLRSHGRVEIAEDYFSSTGDRDYIQVGYNFRMSTMTAALGLSQLAKIEKVIALRRAVGHYYRDNLSKIKDMILPKELEGHFQVYQKYAIQLKDEKTRDALQSYLAKNEIMTKVYHNPIHLKTIYRQQYGYQGGDLPGTEALSKRVLNLPIYPNLAKEEQDYIIKTMEAFFN